MIKIGICDDEQIVREILKQKVEICLREAGVRADILFFQRGQELLETEEDLDILFLDIEMPEMDGIEAGKKLRQKGNNCKIIVATSMVERFKEAFYIDAFRFVTKPFEMEEIREALREAFIAAGGNQTIEAYKNREKYNILCRDILYIEATESSVEFMLKDGKYRKESSLTELEKKLEGNTFFRINRQCIVNMAQIEHYEKGVILINGDTKKVSQRKKKEFQNAYREYKA